MFSSGHAMGDVFVVGITLALLWIGYKIFFAKDDEII